MTSPPPEAAQKGRHLFFQVELAGCSLERMFAGERLRRTQNRSAGPGAPSMVFTAFCMDGNQVHAAGRLAHVKKEPALLWARRGGLAWRLISWTLPRNMSCRSVYGPIPFSVPMRIASCGILDAVQHTWTMSRSTKRPLSSRDWGRSSNPSNDFSRLSLW